MFDAVSDAVFDAVSDAVFDAVFDLVDLVDLVDDPPVHRIELELYTFNQRARSVFERIGFRHEGVRRDALCRDGEFRGRDRHEHPADRPTLITPRPIT